MVFFFVRGSGPASVEILCVKIRRKFEDINIEIQSSTRLNGMFGRFPVGWIALLLLLLLQAVDPHHLGHLLVVLGQLFHAGRRVIELLLLLLEVGLLLVQVVAVVVDQPVRRKR